MKITVAIDSLKGSLTSMEAGEAIKAGILRAVPEAVVQVRPLADGGEGTADALIKGMNGIKKHVSVTGPLGAKTDCMYGVIPAAKTAIIEMSGAAGITLVPQQLRNPLHTTSYGVGEVIRDAINAGCRNFIIGIGGSATNDGGVGMLQALGFSILDKDGKQVAQGAEGLRDIVEVNGDSALPELKECSFRIACDVTNPLCGPNGCSAVFGPQKGADPAMVKDMDQWLHHFAAVTKKAFPEADAEMPGSGAAGGLGYAFLAFLHGKLESGIRIVLEETKLESYIADCDYVVTGEGRLDAQTVMGKAPSGVAEIAAKYHIPVIAFAGSVSKDAGICNAKGIDAFFPILRQVVTLDEAMNSENAKKNMSDTAEQVFRLIHAVEKKTQ